MGGREVEREGRKEKGGSEGVRHRAGLSWNHLYFVAWCISDCFAATIKQHLQGSSSKKEFVLGYGSTRTKAHHGGRVAAGVTGVGTWELTSSTTREAESKPKVGRARL